MGLKYVDSILKPICLFALKQTLDAMLTYPINIVIICSFILLIVLKNLCWTTSTKPLPKPKMSEKTKS
jgi:hypothetical protein